MNRFSKMAVTVALVVVAMAFVMQTGCSTTRTITTTGCLIEEQILENIKVGETTRAELITMLGQPTSSTTEGDKEVLKYEACTLDSCQTSYLYLYTRESRQTTLTQFVFVVQDGVVQSWNKESEETE